MKWIKQGLVYKPENNYDWIVSHAQIPFVDKVSEDVLRVYFGTRDKLNRTVTTFIEVEASNPQNILYIHNKPVLGLGELGCFDDCGAMPSWIINHNGSKYLYYTGWNLSSTVPYRNSIGLATSNDGGITFTRLYEGPILDRTYLEPHFCAAPSVVIEDGLWRMWYLSCVKWQEHDGRPEPYYHIKYAESRNGFNWDRKGLVSINFKSSSEGGIVRPSIIKENNVYKMWYSYRGGKDYRVDKTQSYRIGYAESIDGIDWTRKDEMSGIDVSENGWDSEMIAYPFVYEFGGKKYMFYNGNGFGRSGFGYAILEQ